MTFDFTHGKKANYKVSIHYWNYSDRLYFHELTKAKEAYNREITSNKEKGTIITLYDLNKYETIELTEI